MGNTHKNLLLRNHWANCNQTLVEWCLGGPLPKLCLVIPTSNQDGRQAKTCVRQRRPVSKMAVINKNRNFFKWPKLLYFKPKSAQI